MRRVGIVAVCLVMLAGCATNERVDVLIPSPGASNGSTGTGAAGGPKVVVKPFEDARMDRTHLGSRSHF